MNIPLLGLCIVGHPKHHNSVVVKKIPQLSFHITPLSNRLHLQYTPASVATDGVVSYDRKEVVVE